MRVGCHQRDWEQSCRRIASVKQSRNNPNWGPAWSIAPQVAGAIVSLARHRVFWPYPAPYPHCCLRISPFGHHAATNDAGLCSASRSAVQPRGIRLGRRHVPMAESRSHDFQVPDDIFKLDWLRNFYRQRAAKLRIIVLIRDPRDMLTSRHSITGPNQYFVELNLWTRYCSVMRECLHSSDILLLRYEDLVADTLEMQACIEAFTGETGRRPFVDFHLDPWTQFDKTALNGLRPVDGHSLGRWQRPEHRPRIEELLRHDPHFAGTLVELGYESSTDWVAKWSVPSRMSQFCDWSNLDLRKPEKAV